MIVIPAEIEMLTNLETIIFNNNKLRKIENLDKLSELKRIEFRTNRITEFENLNNLKKLNQLTVSCNLIKSMDDNKIEDLPNLRELGLFGNFLGDENNEEINFDLFHKFLITISNKMINLRIIYLGGNHFAKIKSMKSIIKNALPNLEFLDGTKL